MSVTKEEMHEIMARIQSLLDLAIEAGEIQDIYTVLDLDRYDWRESMNAGEMYEEAYHMAKVEFAALMARI